MVVGNYLMSSLLQRVLRLGSLQLAMAILGTVLLGCMESLL